jgi:uncharacterized SAM-binding protein YcdF (DUF218 family)
MNVDKWAKIVWDYMRMNMQPEKSDAIFVLCSHDTRVAERAADLYNEGFAPWVIVSGGAGKLTQDIFDKPEAEVFKNILIKSGVPEDRIILEPNAANTGENVQFTNRLLQSLGKAFTSFILVQKPYMERRTYATFKKQWPDSSTKISVTSPTLNYEEYMAGSAIDKNFVISVMVGDLQRIREYPDMGYQIEQEIPDEVGKAYEELVNAGYTQHLMASAN